jgi:hypothetical protein
VHAFRFSGAGGDIWQAEFEEFNSDLHELIRQKKAAELGMVVKIRVDSIIWRTPS